MGGFDHQKRKEDRFPLGIEIAHAPGGARGGFEEVRVDVVEKAGREDEGSFGIEFDDDRGIFDDKDAHAAAVQLGVPEQEEKG